MVGLVLLIGFIFFEYRKFESLEVSLFSHNQMKFLVNFDPWESLILDVSLSKAQNLKKTFQKLDHDVNIREFIASRYVRKQFYIKISCKKLYMNINFFSSLLFAFGSLVSVIQQ